MINIVSQPQKFSPVNIANFNISSDRANLSYFDLKVLTTDGNTIIARQRYYPLPNYTSGATFDLSSVLAASVDNQLINNSNVLDVTSNLLLGYKVSIVDAYLSGSTIVTGSTFTSDTFNVWNGELSRIDVADYDYHKYAISNSSTGLTQFLTDIPLVNNIYKNSSQYLYFLNDGVNSSIRLDFYSPGHQFIQTKFLSGTTSDMSAVRLNISPADLSLTVSGLIVKNFQPQFTIQFGSVISMLSAGYFTLTLVDAITGVALSETRTYILKSIPKCKQSLELIYSNTLGGWDSIVCFNPMESISTERSTISRYPYQLNAGGVYTDLNNGIYNETTSIISTTNTSTYSCVTDILSDSMAKALRSIITAEHVFLRLANGRLYPVSIANSSYSVQLKKYSTNNNRLSIQFKCDIAGLFD